MTLAFIVRVEFDGRRWRLTLQDLASGERHSYPTFDACYVALRDAAERRMPLARRGERDVPEGFVEH